MHIPFPLHSAIALGIVLGASAHVALLTSERDIGSLIVSSDNVDSSHLYSPRQAKPPALPPQTIELVNMDETQQLEVLEALQAAAWLGEMAVTQLTATTSASQTTPEFQQFFGTYDGDRRRILLDTAGRLQNIMTNGMVGRIIYRSETPDGHENAVAVTNGRVITLYPAFFDRGQYPNLVQLSVLPSVYRNDGPVVSRGVRTSRLRHLPNRAISLAHEFMHLPENANPAFTLGGEQMIEDIEWNQVNGLGPNQNPNYPSNDNAIYTPSRAIDLAALNPAAAIQNASNYQWYIMAVYAFLSLFGNLPEMPAFPNKAPFDKF